MIAPEAIAAVEALRAGLPASDDDFDRLYPPRIQRASRRYWTPVEVALLASRLLVESGATRILDVGAGVGKLCIVGGLSTRALFTGIERRRALVEIGREALERAGLRRTVLLHGELEAVDWQSYDGLYFFNPFEENIYDPVEQLDQSVPLSDDRYVRDVALAEQALRAAPDGTRVVTYHGFGGTIPATYRLVGGVPAGSDRLRLWIQSARGGDDGRGPRARSGS